MKRRQLTIDTMGEETHGWKEAQRKYDDGKEELNSQIELGIGFYGLREILAEWGEGKVRNANEKGGPRVIEDKSPSIHGEYEREMAVRNEANKSIAKTLV